MVMMSEAPQGQRMVPRHTFEVCDGMSIAQAIANADALGDICTILVYKGIYDEGDLATTGGAIITLKRVDEGVYIAPTLAPAVAVVNITDTLHLENITVISPDNTRPAVLVNTPAGAPTTNRCVIIGTGGGYSLQMTQGMLNDHFSVFSGDVHLSTARCLLDCFHSTFMGDIITAAEALNHDIDLMSCELTQGSILSLATGATVIACAGCSDVDAVTNSGTGLFTLLGSYVNSVSCLNAGGEIRLRGGTLNTVTRAVGSVVWWRDGVTIDVLPCATATDPVIGHAITAGATAAGVDEEVNLMLHSGLYNEAPTCASYVNLKGLGTRGSVIIYQNDADIITYADDVDLQGFTLRFGTPLANRNFTKDGAAACNVDVDNIEFEVVTPGAFKYSLFNLSGGSTIGINHCLCNIVQIEVLSLGGAANTILVTNNDFRCTSSASMLIHNGAEGSIINGFNNRWGIAGYIFYMSSGSVTLDHDTIVSARANSFTLSTCNVILRHCTIDTPVSAGNGATVRMKNCSYRSILRTGTGNIVDESPYLSDAPWHIERWNWQAALANAQVAVRGVPLDAGSGQIIIETLDSGAGVMAVETLTENARSLGNEFTPARTPRFLTQISAHTDDGSGAGNPAFDPHVTMFYGLRQTLGNALPAAAEHHAGFVWDGTNFMASSDDGAATETTNLTTPSDDAQHQLEIIIFAGRYVEFYADGVLVATHSTRVPSAVLDWQHLIIGLGTGAGDTISVTVRNGGTMECPA